MLVGLVVSRYLLVRRLTSCTLLRSVGGLLRGQLIRGRLLAARTKDRIAANRRFSTLRSSTFASYVRRVCPWLLIRGLANGSRSLRVEVLFLYAATGFCSGDNKTARTGVGRCGI